MGSHIPPVVSIHLFLLAEEGIKKTDLDDTVLKIRINVGSIKITNRAYADNVPPANTKIAFMNANAQAYR